MVSVIARQRRRGGLGKEEEKERVTGKKSSPRQLSVLKFCRPGKGIGIT